MVRSTCSRMVLFTSPSLVRRSLSHSVRSIHPHPTPKPHYDHTRGTQSGTRTALGVGIFFAAAFVLCVVAIGIGKWRNGKGDTVKPEPRPWFGRGKRGEDVATGTVPRSLSPSL